MSLAANRRLTLRVDAHDSVAVLDLNRPDAVTLVDLSLGGFLLTGPRPYPLGAMSEFLFEDVDGRWNARISARAVHSHQRDASDHGEAFVTGFAFVDADAPAVHSRITTLFERVSSASAFADPPTGLRAREEWPFTRFGGTAR